MAKQACESLKSLESNLGMSSIQALTIIQKRYSNYETKGLNNYQVIVNSIKPSVVAEEQIV